MNLQRLTRYSLVVSLLLFIQINLQAQDRTVTGRVLNQDNKEPLSGVSINVKGSSHGAVTNERGVFSLTLPPGKTSAVLGFSHVGFGYKEIPTGSEDTLTVLLAPSNKKMDDVIVIGYGTQKRGNVLGAVSTVDPKEVLDLPVANLSTALKNMAPGVGVSQSSGKPGSTTTLTIRNAVVWGASGTNSPLFVIDGIAPAIAASGSVDATGKTAFDNLDPSQIESISFLKDAAATIYGARGAYGVVLVTTRKGKAGKPRLSYSGSYTTEDAIKMPDMLDGYDQALLLNNTVQNYKPSAVVSTEIYTPDELAYAKAHNYNWLQQAWQKGYTQKHALTVSGGSDKITFFAGGNLYDETGNIKSVSDTKYGYRFGLTARIISGLTADIVVAGDNNNLKRPGVKGTATAEQSDQMNATVGGLLHVPGWAPIYNSSNQPLYYSPLAWHPSALINGGSYVKSNATSNSINLALNYAVPTVPGLSFNVQYARNTYSSFGKEYYASYNTYNPTKIGVHTNNTPGTNKATGTQNIIAYPDSLTSVVTNVKNGNQLTESTSTSTNWQANEGIRYQHSFGDHDLSVMVLSEQSQVKGDYVTTTEGVQIIPNVDQFYAFSNDQTNWQNSGNSTSGGRVSFMGRLNYAYKGKYLFESSFRDDASPNFPDKHRWGLFSSAAIGWKISEENFFRDNIKFFDDLKIRFSAGLTGNDQTSGAFTWVTRYTATGNYGYLFGTTVANGLQYSTIPNPEISWERSFKKDLGFDGTFANRKFNFSTDFWYSHDYDKLETPSATVPNTYGGNKFADVNHGEMNAYGIEASLGYNATIGRSGFQVFATINFGISDNKIISKYYNLNSDTGYLNPIGKRSDLGITGYVATGIVRTQDEVNAFYAKHPGWLINSDSLRVGDMNFKDIDGDGKITSTDQTQIAKRSSSIFGMGFNIGCAWKGFRFSTNISLSVGGKMAWRKADIAVPTKDVSSLSMWKNAYTAANPNAALPAIYAPLATETSSFWLRNATTMYINNMQLSYALPPALVTRYRLPDCRMYITGINLWSLINPTPFKDPRANAAADYPILRSWTFGLNVTL